MGHPFRGEKLSEQHILHDFHIHGVNNGSPSLLFPELAWLFLKNFAHIIFSQAIHFRILCKKQI